MGKHTVGTARLGSGRTNDGQHPILLDMGDDSLRIALADFRGEAKRGQGYAVDDPEGRANADRLALCWNLHDQLIEGLKLAIGSMGADTDHAREAKRRIEAIIAKAEG